MKKIDDGEVVDIGFGFTGAGGIVDEGTSGEIKVDFPIASRTIATLRFPIVPKIPDRLIEGEEAVV